MSEKPYQGEMNQLSAKNNRVNKRHFDSRSQGRRNAGAIASTSVGRKGNNRDVSNIRKERIQAAKDEKEKKQLNMAAVEIKQMYTRLLELWTHHKVPDQHK